MIVEIELSGNVPSKKNSRINLSSGKSIPSAKYRAWRNAALWQVKQQTRHLFTKPVKLEVVVYFSTKIRADLDNRVTSILDMLVDALVLQDDKWQNVPEIHAKAEYRQHQPGALIRLIEIEKQ